MCRSHEDTPVGLENLSVEGLVTWLGQYSACCKSVRAQIRSPPSMKEQGAVVHNCGDRWIPGVHRPDGVADSVSSRLRERLCLKT